MTVHRYCFIAGLHRSGTTLLAHLLGRHPDIAAFTCAHVPENEGVYAQGAIPHTARHGIPGSFAYDPSQHLTETSNFNTNETAQRIEREWSPWFQAEKPWRLEKSPVNLLRMRLYQQLFPLAHFIVITRHPMAVTQALRKWSHGTDAELLDHWGHAHAIACHDLPYLHCALVVRYEDLCLSPAKTLEKVTAFLGLSPLAKLGVQLRNGNADYTACPEVSLPDIANRLGYSSVSLNPSKPVARAIKVRHVFRATRTAVEAINNHSQMQH